SRILSPWFSVEYCWCSVDMRTYCAARNTGPDPVGLGGDSFDCIDPVTSMVDVFGSAVPFNGCAAAERQPRIRLESLPCRMIENPFGGEVTGRSPRRRSSPLLTRPSCADTSRPPA